VRFTLGRRLFPTGHIRTVTRGLVHAFRAQYGSKCEAHLQKYGSFGVGMPQIIDLINAPF